MARKASKRLTPKGVRALKKEGYFADSEAVGLYVQVAHRQRDGKLDRKHGVTRSWVYRYTSPVTKKVRMMGLGSCDVIPLAEARNLAKAARRLVTLGDDPIEHRNATAAAAREAYLREQDSRIHSLDLWKPLLGPIRSTSKVARTTSSFLFIQWLSRPILIQWLNTVAKAAPSAARRGNAKAYRK
jgi:hypothetical protein